MVFEIENFVSWEVTKFDDFDEFITNELRKKQIVVISVAI